MRMIIGLLLFWISIFGYLLLLKKKTKLPYEFILPIVFTLIGIVMFVAGILNMMKEITILVCLFGCIIFGIKLFKKEIKFRELLKSNFIILLLIFVYITVVCGRMNILHYDNFSHWGLIVKNMFINNRLPNFENPVIEFKNYQPGSACFIYYFGALVGKSEGSMIIGQNYLLVAYFFSLLAFTNPIKKLKNKKNLILKVMLVVVFLFMLFGNIAFNDLLVDTLIAVMSIFSFALIYYFRDDLKKAFIYNLPLLVYLFLVKNTGIVLVGFSCLGLVYLGFRNKQFKKGFIYAILTGIITVIFFYIWSKHVSYVYGVISLSSKHSLSASNMGGQLLAKGWSGIFEFCKIYLNHFIDVFNNLPNKYMIGIYSVVLVMICFYKKYRKDFINCLIVITIIYFMYYGILGVMYLLSMPWAEASYLAGFDRYMLTIIFIIIGIVLICFINVVMKDKEFKKSYLFVTLVAGIFLVLSFKYHINDYKILLGDLDYENTTAYKFDEILETDRYSANYNDYYYIYAPIASYNDSGYVYYLSKYKLNTDKVNVVKDTNQFDEEISDTYNKKILLLDVDKEILNFIEENDYIRNGNIYIKYNKEENRN